MLFELKKSMASLKMIGRRDRRVNYNYVIRIGNHMISSATWNK